MTLRKEFAIALPLGLAVSLGLTACHGTLDMSSNRNAARAGLNAVLDQCPSGNARFQSSSTNEAGAVWFTLRCERNDAGNNLQPKEVTP